MRLSSFAATLSLARRLAPLLRGGNLVILAGPLGSGKTYFARALLRQFGLPRSVRVTSPTFTLVHEYDTLPQVIHADLYRISAPEEVLELGLVEKRTDGRLLLVEWGESYVEELGGDALVVRFTLDPRQAFLSATGVEAKKLLSELKA